MVTQGKVENIVGSKQVGSSAGKFPSLRSEEGNAFIEFLFCFPFVLLVFISSIDLGRALNAYFAVTRVVYEGARYAGQVGGLESGTFQTAAAANTRPGHMRVRARVDTLLLRYNIMPGTPSDYLSTACIQCTPTVPGGTCPSGDRDRVRIGLRVTFDPIFPLFQSMLGILSTDATGPYLYLACT